MKFENWMAFKFILENKKRIVFPFLAITVSTVVVSLSLIIRDAISKTVIGDLRNIGKNTILIGGDTISKEDIYFIKSIPDVDYYFFSDQTRKDGDFIFKSYSNILLEKMNLPQLRENDIVLDKEQFLDKKIGETIILKVKGESKEFLIRAFYLERNPLETMKVGKRVILSEDGFKNNIANENNTRVAITFKEDIDSKSYIPLVLNNLNRERKSKLSLLETPEIFKKINNIIEILNKTLLILLIISLSLGGFFIFNITASFILERKDNIGILRAMGVNDSRIFKIFLLQNIYILVFGFFCGGLLSYIFLNIIEATLNITIYIDTLKIFIFIILTIVLGNVLGILQIKRLKKISIIDLLKI